MKKIITLASITMVLTSAFMQPAAARIRRGNLYGVMGANAVDMTGQFKLFETEDTDSNLYRGFFKGAIVDYVNGYGGIFRGVERPFKKSSTIFDVGNLVVDVVKDDNSNLVIVNNFSDFDIDDVNTYVRYSFYGQNESDAISSWLLSTTRLEQDQKENQELPFINNLAHILDRFSLVRAINPNYINTTITSDNADRLFEYSIDEIAAVSVPEPQPVNNIASLLALIFATYFVLRRNIKQD